MYAVIETGGKQYRVAVGEVLSIEKLDQEDGSQVHFDKVLMLAKDGEVTIGRPYIEDARVQATVVGHGKGKKILVFKYKPKKNYRKRIGHRQPYTAVKITAIEG